MFDVMDVPKKSTLTKFDVKWCAINIMCILGLDSLFLLKSPIPPSASSPSTLRLIPY